MGRQIFDVIVTLNLYGDILSDIASQISGSVGIAGSANIGDGIAMFEAVHGSAPDIAGKDVANPSGLLVAATQLLSHVGLADVAERIKNAWLATLEDGVHTPDIHGHGFSAQRVGTQELAQAVIARLGSAPKKLTPVHYQTTGISVGVTRRAPSSKELVGVDAFLDWAEADRDPLVLAHALEAATLPGWKLKMITNRGSRSIPTGCPRPFAPITGAAGTYRSTSPPVCPGPHTIGPTMDTSSSSWRPCTVLGSM